MSLPFSALCAGFSSLWSTPSSEEPWPCSSPATLQSSSITFTKSWEPIRNGDYCIKKAKLTVQFHLNKFVDQLKLENLVSSNILLAIVCSKKRKFAKMRWNITLLPHNVCFAAGSEIVFHRIAEEGDADYVDYWERFLKEPQKFTYDAIDDALQLVGKNQVVLFVTYNMLKSYYRL